MDEDARGQQEDAVPLSGFEAGRGDETHWRAASLRSPRVAAAAAVAMAALAVLAVARPWQSAGAPQPESDAALPLTLQGISADTGCSNWAEILVGMTPEVSWEACAEACQLHPAGCTSFAYSTCVPGTDTMCHLYSGWCEPEISECWDLVVADSITQLEELHSTVPRCMISCQGHDGIGHQIEAKLTCIGAAASRGMSYVHQPMRSAEHGMDPAEFEAFFSLGLLGRPLSALWDPQMKNRNGPPKDGFDRWKPEFYAPMMGTFCSTTSSYNWCEMDGHSVYTEVDCNDLFYCPEGMAGWYSVLPGIQHAYYSTPKPDSNWLDGFTGSGWGQKVAMHVRRGDTEYPVDAEYYVRMLDKLRYELTDATSAVRPMFRVQTDARREELLQEVPSLLADDVVIDDKYGTPLDLALHRMVTADVLVTSASSLSVAAALIGNNSRVLAPCMVGRTTPSSAPILHWEKDQHNCP